MSQPKSRGNQRIETKRQVIDPVTHLPLDIHDYTLGELQQEPDQGTGPKQKYRSMEQVLNGEAERERWSNSRDLKHRMNIKTAIIAAGSAGVGGTGSLLLLWVGRRLLGNLSFSWVDISFGTFGCSIFALGIGAYVLSSVRSRTFDSDLASGQHPPDNKPSNYHDNERKDSPESALWLNSLIHSLWPIVNPVLFTSIADMLEDALQATLPKLVHGVRVADIGQGSEPLRVLGIRRLDAGSASQEKGGMKAEEGDFVNFEVAVAYRARSTSGSGLRDRSSNAHLLTEFLVAGGMVLPVWVELTGILAMIRMRIRLTPNPPFLSVLTMTLLGQPKITMICTPLAKNFLNIMDIPGLSGWLQRSVDAAVAEYVAPMSLNLDLKTILSGRGKMDIDTVGVVVITIRSAKEFKEGDGKGILRSNSGRQGDAYVTAGWSKWGKPIWSTRIIKGDDNPVWEETTTLLVGPAETNAEEILRLQLWDYDRLTADDLLGTIQVPLYEIMTSSQTHNRISVREDRISSNEGSPSIELGTLLWECGYFSKVTLERHLAGRRDDVGDIERSIKSEAEKKLREAEPRRGETEEIEQQKKEDLKEKSDEIISGTSPSVEWPSGVLSVRIEQINGLEIQKIKESGVREGGEDEESDDLPSAYCTVIINHQRVYKTRTRLKSNKPFFDAGTEKFIKDWQNTTVIVAVRDARLHEIDPLLGVVVLPLQKLFKHCSYVNDSLPLVGGIGYGRMRFSLTFRSIQVRLPRRLLGWDIGTLDIQPYVRASLDLPADLASCKLLFRTVYGKGKMASHQDGGWKQKRGRSIRLPVNKRYASCLLVQFVRHGVGLDKATAFSTLWLKDIPDSEEIGISLPVHKNENGSLARARANSRSDFGEHVGTIDMKLCFWPGLSGYHQNIADQDMDMADVMEVLDCAEESQEIGQDLPHDKDSDSEASSSSSSQEEVLESGKGEKKASVSGGFAGYQKRKGELHRKHRGLMQWKAARNLAWVGRGIENTAGKLGHKLTGNSKYQDRNTAIEKEV